MANKEWIKFTQKKKKYHGMINYKSTGNSIRFLNTSSHQWPSLVYDAGGKASREEENIVLTTWDNVKSAYETEKKKFEKQAAGNDLASCVAARKAQFINDLIYVGENSDNFFSIDSHAFQPSTDFFIVQGLYYGPNLPQRLSGHIVVYARGLLESEVGKLLDQHSKSGLDQIVQKRGQRIFANYQAFSVPEEKVDIVKQHDLIYEVRQPIIQFNAIQLRI